MNEDELDAAYMHLLEITIDWRHAVEQNALLAKRLNALTPQQAEALRALIGQFRRDFWQLLGLPLGDNT
jgi:hypothetical protein